MSFQFKQFSVLHEASSMKVGTDAVLLGAFIQTEKQEKILEVGTGCGVVALMLAQKGNRVLAIDIHAPSVEESQQNFSNSVFAPLLIADEIDELDFDRLSVAYGLSKVDIGQISQAIPLPLIPINKQESFADRYVDKDQI
jgi:tRNA1Val (adenine37-N6)-methyltransferase